MLCSVLKQVDRCNHADEYDLKRCNRSHSNNRSKAAHLAIRSSLPYIRDGPKTGRLWSSFSAKYRPTQWTQQQTRKTRCQPRRTKGLHHALQKIDIGCRGCCCVFAFNRLCSGRARLWPERLAQCLGRVPILDSRDRSTGTCNLYAADGLIVRLPAGIMAWSLGALPQYTVSRSPAERRLAMKRRCTVD
jgi:hypothetical protein